MTELKRTQNYSRLQSQFENKKLCLTKNCRLVSAQKLFHTVGLRLFLPPTAMSRDKPLPIGSSQSHRRLAYLIGAYSLESRK